MPPTGHQGASIPFASFRRSILGTSVDHNQIHSVEMSHDLDSPESDLSSFQKHVNDCLHNLSSVGPDEFLSATWIKKLLDSFLSCQEQFRLILCNNKARFSKPPLDKITSDFFEKSIKALDICNAIRDGIEKIRVWHKHLEIVLSALDSRQKTVGEGQFRRARKALMDLALLMLDEKDSGSVFSTRHRSFGRHNTSKDQHNRQQPGHSRSLSWSVSRSWSAAKQIQSMANTLVAPRGNEIAATNGLVVPIYTMCSVLVFVLWALVAAIPCQDRGIQVHFSIPRQYSWATPLLLLHDRIVEESKKRDKRNANGLMREIFQIEKSIRHMTDLVDSIQFPISEEQKGEVEKGVGELALVFESCKSELDPLEKHVREVFRKIMSCRTEGLELLSQGSTSG